MDPFIYLDIQTIILQLRKDGVRDVQCVGAGFGGTLCLQAITTQTPMSQVAIISPITPVRHQSVMSNIDAYPDFPLFVIAGAQDAISLPAVLRLEEKRTLLLLNPNTSKRGTIILIEYPEMEKELRMWIWKKSDKFPRSPMKIGATIEVKGEKLPYWIGAVDNCTKGMPFGQIIFDFVDLFSMLKSEKSNDNIDP